MDEDIVLAGKNGIKRLRRNAGACAYVPDRDTGVALFSEQLHCRVHDAFFAV